MFKVLVPRTISHTGTDYLTKKGCELILSAPKSADDPVFEQCHAILTGPTRKFRYDKPLLDRCKNLKVSQASVLELTILIQFMQKNWASR